MATRRWAGAAPRVAQVNTFAFGGTWEANDTILASFSNGKSYLFTAGSTTTATVVSNLVTTWNALASADYPEFAEITASASTTTLTLTGDTAGKPFTVTLTPFESDGSTTADAQTIEGGSSATTGTAATACSGPNFWSIAANWLEGSVPANSDDVYVDGGPSILYGTAQSGVTLATLTIGPNFPATSEIGLPANTSPGQPSAGYPEYRQQRLYIGATAVTIETTSRRVRLDLSPANTTVVVRSTGTPAQATEDALDLKANNASAAVFVQTGIVGLNYQAGDSGTVADLNVNDPGQGGTARVRCGAGLTLTRLDQAGGEVLINNGATTVLKAGGTLTVAAGAVTTLTNRGGTVYHDGAGTITALNNRGTFLRRGFRTGTVTDATLYGGSRTVDRNGTLTWTNPPQFSECRLPAGPDDTGPDVAYADFGVSRKLTVANI